MKPPEIMMLTPNGRFEVGKKICLTISAHHPESWQPSWSIRTVMMALIGFLPTPGGGAIGSLDYTAPERRALAKRSMGWKCPTCEVAMESALSDTCQEVVLSGAEEKALQAMKSIGFSAPRSHATSENKPEPASPKSPPVPSTFPGIDCEVLVFGYTRAGLLCVWLRDWT